MLEASSLKLALWYIEQKARMIVDSAMNKGKRVKNELFVSQVYGLDHMAQITPDNLAWGKNRALAISVIDSLNLLIAKGEIKFMSALDAAYTYGFTRQYWDLLLASRKIPHYSHRGGKLTLNIFIEDYLAERYGQEYIPILKRTIKRIRLLAARGRNNEKLFCPNCDSKNMHFVFTKKVAKAKCKFCKYRVKVVLCYT